MKKLTPEEFNERLQAQKDNVAKLKKLSVKVGIVSNSVGPYENGQTALDVGLIHEYGTEDIPRRSFLRAPFLTKKKEMDSFIQKQFQKVIEDGFPAEKAMELIGVKAQSISQEAFTTGGFGQWAELSQSTIEKKGSSQILLDTGTLRNSITYEVVK